MGNLEPAKPQSETWRIAFDSPHGITPIIELIQNSSLLSTERKAEVIQCLQGFVAHMTWTLEFGGVYDFEDGTPYIVGPKFNNYLAQTEADTKSVEIDYPWPSIATLLGRLKATCTLAFPLQTSIIDQDIYADYGFPRNTEETEYTDRDLVVIAPDSHLGLVMDTVIGGVDENQFLVYRCYYEELGVESTTSVQLLLDFYTNILKARLAEVNISTTQIDPQWLIFQVLFDLAGRKLKQPETDSKEST